MSHRYLSFIQVTSYLTSKQRLLFGTTCFHQRPKLSKLTTRRPKTAVVVRYFTLCSSQGTNSYDDDGSSDNDLRNNVSVMVPKPLTIPLQDDTQLTFMFSYADMLQLVEKLNQLVLSFRQAAEAVAQRKKHEVQPVFEYYCQRDGLFIHMECNPNLFTSAFQAQFDGCVEKMESGICIFSCCLIKPCDGNEEEMRLAEKDRPSPPTTSSSRVSFISQTTTTTTTTPAAQQDSPHSCPPWVQLETNLGTLLLELYWKHAPKTCYNFAQLAQRQYYDDVVFHRIVHDFIVQGGDPTGTGRGGTSIYGDVFEDEITDELRHTGAGILSMANAGPNTNSSQFFLTLAPTPNLDGKHTIFGRVKRGIHVLKRIGNVETDSYDRSLQTVKILKAYPVEH